MKHAARRSTQISEAILSTTAYAVRAVLFDGASVDLMMFHQRQDAEQHATDLRGSALAYGSLSVVERLIIGKPATV